MARKRMTTGEVLRQRGFDKSTYDRNTGSYRVKCSQCEAIVVNGIACHESGCPNAQPGRPAKTY